MKWVMEFGYFTLPTRGFWYYQKDLHQEKDKEGKRDWDLHIVSRRGARKEKVLENGQAFYYWNCLHTSLALPATWQLFIGKDAN